jgi:hypothetical protein
MATQAASSVRAARAEKSVTHGRSMSSEAAVQPSPRVDPVINAEVLRSQWMLWS